MERGGHIYIMTNKRHTVLYTGVTSNLVNCIWEHKNKVYPNSFTAKYNCDKLVYTGCFRLLKKPLLLKKQLKAEAG